MDEALRALERQYERGDINVIQWMKVLQRASLPHHHLLIETWERLLVPNDTTVSRRVDRSGGGLPTAYSFDPR